MPDETREENLPPEVIVDNTLMDLTKQVQDIRYERDNLPPAKGPSFHPSGTPYSPWTAEMREQRKLDLQKHEFMVKKDGMAKLDKTLEKTSVSVQINSYKKIYAWQDAHKSEHDAKFETTEKKDAISKAQEIAVRKMSNREPIHPVEPSSEDKNQPERISPEGLEEKQKSVLNEYNSNIGYNSIDEPDKSPDKTDKTPEMEWVENKDDML